MTDYETELLPVRLTDRTLELEIRWIAREHRDLPLIVFLHEGLGSVAMWGDWPERLCTATGCRGLVFSRHGYGRSTPRPAGQPWPVDYLEQEARVMLPALFSALDIDVRRDKPILFGHSDGGSIALLHAAAFPDAVAAAIVLAPHVFVEDISLTRIRQAQQVYAMCGLGKKLGDYHDDPDRVFRGWSERWLSPAFRAWNITSSLHRLSCPLLAVQGRQDQYGTLAQLDEIKRYVPQTELLVIEQCRHIPHQEQPQVLLDGITRFLGTVQG